MNINKNSSNNNNNNNDLDKSLDKVLLDKCLKYIYDIGFMGEVDNECYKVLTFPNNPRVGKKIVSNIKFYNNFGKRVKITSPIKIIRHKLIVPKELKNELKEHKSMTITPIICDNKKYYGLLQDVKYDTWQLFTLPGTNNPKSSFIENSIIDLIENKFKFEIDLFYGFIKYLPKPNTYHYDWWSSWVIYQSIKYPGLEREILVNKALALLLHNDPSYNKFIKSFTFTKKIY